MSRMASPEDFGTIALLGAFLLVSNVVSELGSSTTVVRLKYNHPKILSTYFWFTGLASTIVAILYILLIPSLSEFFTNDLIRSYGILIAPVIISTGFATVPSAIIIQKQLFKKKAIMALLANITSVVIGLLIALLHSPMIGLLCIFLLNPLLLNIMVLFFIHFQLKRFFVLGIIKRRLEFSLHIMISNLLDQLSRSSIIFGLSFIFGAGMTGVYTRAETVRNIFAFTFDKIVQRVSFSELVHSANQNVHSTCVEHVTISRNLALILAPICVIILMQSNDIIYILFGPEWEQSSDFLKLLAPTVLVIPLISSNITLFKSLGLSRNVLFLKAIQVSLVIIIFMLVGNNSDVVISAVSAGYFLVYGFSLINLYKIKEYDTKLYLCHLGLSIFPSFLTVIIISMVSFYRPQVLASFIIDFFIFTIVYISAFLITKTVMRMSKKVK